MIHAPEKPQNKANAGGKITNPIKEHGGDHKPGRNNAETGITKEIPGRDNTSKGYGEDYLLSNTGREICRKRE